MIHITKLLRGGHFAGDRARYPEPGRETISPVVVWHMTGACNLRCRHCYASNPGSPPDGIPQMSRGETFAFLDRLAVLNPPSLLLSGGEPLSHPDFFEYLDYAVSRKLRVSLSTNGTLIDAETAARMKEKGVGYIGVSLDGMGRTHDDFRGVNGSFIRALSGIRALKYAGCRVGLRFTMAQPLLPDIPDVMKLAEDLAIERICFYHFIPSGRGRSEVSFVPSREEMRTVLLNLFEWVERENTHASYPEEVLTVGNFSDGLLLYLTLKEQKDARAENVLSLLGRHGGGRSGRGIVSVRWDGVLFADQFSWDRPMGRWPDIGKTYSAETQPAFKGRCAGCRWVQLCRGNMRARAAAMTGNPSGEDPGCVLLDGEICGAPVTAHES